MYLPKDDSLIQKAAATIIDSGLSLAESTRVMEAATIIETLKRTRGNKLRSAQKLQVHRNTLQRKIDLIGLGQISENIKKQARSAPRQDSLFKMKAAG